MKWNTLEEEPCSVTRTLTVIGERWTLLILREQRGLDDRAIRLNSFGRSCQYRREAPNQSAR